MELPIIEHKPFQPPRDGTPGEGIFLRKWQEFAKRAAEQADGVPDEDEFLSIFYHAVREFSQPMASAAASFITWLGTNCGHSFLHQCARESGSRRRDEDHYLCTWALENARLAYMNHGLRLVEYLVAERQPVRSNGLAHSVDWSLVPTVTLEHLDAIECVVRWLASSQGRAFVAACEAELEAARKNERLFGDGGVLEGTNRTTSGMIGQP